MRSIYLRIRWKCLHFLAIQITKIANFYKSQKGVFDNIGDHHLSIAWETMFILKTTFSTVVIITIIILRLCTASETSTTMMAINFSSNQSLAKIQMEPFLLTPSGYSICLRTRFSDWSKKWVFSSDYVSLYLYDYKQTYAQYKVLSFVHKWRHSRRGGGSINDFVTTVLKPFY